MTIAPRLAAWVPLTLVVLALGGTVTTPLVLRQRMRRIRLETRRVGEPTRLLLGDLRFGLAREQWLAQRAAIVGDAATRRAYGQVVAHDDSLVNELRTMTRGLEPGPRQAVGSLIAAVNRSRGAGAIAAVSPPNLGRRAIPSNAVYEDALRATLPVDSAVSRAMQQARSELEASEMAALRATIGFVALGCLATAAVVVLTLRSRQLSDVLRRRAEEATTLRTLARTLSGARSVREVASATVAATVRSSRVGGAYVAAVEGDQLVVLSAQGDCGSRAGARLPIPKWLLDVRTEKDPPVFMSETRPDGQNGSRSLLVVPMRYDGEVIGAVALVSAGGRRTFSAWAARYGRAVGDLTAVAMHRAAALEREQHARAQAEEAVRARDAVVSIVSHDLRNPLTAIVAGTSFLLEEFGTDGRHETERTQLAQIKHAASNMTRLINDLLDVARLESGPLPLRCAPVAMVDVLDEVLEMFHATARTRRIELQRSIDGPIPPVWGDRDRIAQALSNVMGNAVKFTPDGGRVRVAITADDHVVRVAVRDSGPGIPAEDLPHLFDRFWQATRDRGGLGLGLTIVKGVMDAHGGSVEVESRPTDGATIKLVFARPAKLTLVSHDAPAKDARRPAAPIDGQQRPAAQG